MTKRVAISIPELAHGVPIPNASMVGDLLMSGSISGRNPKDGTLSSDPDTEIRQVFSNISEVLRLGQCSMDDVVKMVFFVKDRSLRSVLDPIWIEYFPDPTDRPARHVISSDDTGRGLIQAEITAMRTNHGAD